MAGLFSPTIETGGGQPVQATNVQSPSTATQLAPAVAQGASQLFEFFGKRGAAEAKATATMKEDDVKRSFNNKLEQLAGMARTGKGVNTSMLRSRADKLVLEYRNSNPSLTDYFGKQRKEVYGIAGLGKTLAEGTPEEQQELSNRKKASDAGAILPSMTEEEKVTGTNAHMKQLKALSDLDYNAKNTAASEAQKASESKDALFKLYQGSAVGFSLKSNDVVRRYENGEITAEAAKQALIELKNPLDLLASGLTRHVDKDFVSTQNSFIENLFNNSLDAITNNFGLDVLKNKNDKILAIHTNEMLKDPRLGKVVAMSNLFKDQNQALFAKADSLVTELVGGMEGLLPMPNLFDNTEEGKAARGTAYEMLLSKVQKYNADPSSVDEAGLFALESSVNNLLDGVAKGQLNIGNPSNLKDFVTFFSNPQFGKMAESVGGMLPNNAVLAQDVVQTLYTDKVIPKIKRKMEEATTSARPSGRTIVRGGALMDYVDINTDNGTIKFVRKGGLTLDPVQSNSVISGVRELNGDLAPLLNEIVRFGAHITGSTNYTQFLNQNVDSLFGLRSQEESAKPTPKVNDSIDQIAELNKAAGVQGVELSSFEDGDYTDGTQTFTIKGGKIVGVK